MITAHQDVETLNTENILKVADAIEHYSISDVGFSMLRVYDDKPNCGATACIAGWTNLLLSPAGLDHPNELKHYMTVEPSESMDDAGRLLGLTERVQDRLFVPGNSHKVNDKQAVRTLRHLAKTGDVDFYI